MEIYLCSPASPQARTIARLINRHQPDTIIYGLLFANESPFSCKAIERFYDVNELEISKVYGQVLPTSAKSTQFFLEMGDVAFGEVVLKKDALKVFNKPWILEQANLSSVPTPRTWTKTGEIEVYPVFFKQNFEKGGGVRGLAYRASDIPVDNHGDLLFQEYIDSPGTYGLGFIAKNGQLIVTHAHYERASNPGAGGSAVIIESFDGIRLEELTARILSRLNYSGWGLAEFKYCPKRNDFVFMEINARFWASCELAFANEPAFAKLLFNIDKQNEEIERMLFMNRALRRGPAFMAKNVKYFSNSKIILYPGVVSSMAVGFVPSFLIRLVRNLRRSA